MARRYRFQCPNCGGSFEKSLVVVLLLPHITGRGIRVRCPACGTAGWMPPLPEPPDPPSLP
jgi:uncharacterized Zn finger protein